MSYYKKIDGVNYDRELLEKAEELISGTGDGRISFDDAKELLDAAMDGARITRIEHRTLTYVLDNFNVTDKARAYLDEHLFRIIDGQRYDLLLIDAADLAVEGQGDGRISFDDAQLIWRLVDADGHVTVQEIRTLRYILSTYKCTEKAEEFLSSNLSR